MNGLADWIADVVQSLGYVGIATLVALENLFPPLPSELILPLAGFLAGQGRLSLAGVIVAATLGSLVGALALYAAGAGLGQRRLRAIAARTPLVDAADVDRAAGWFARHGERAVLLGRMVPVVRSLVSVPAGVEHMPLGRFIAYTVLGSAAWNTILIGLGFVVGERWELVRGWAQVFEWLVLGVLAVLLVAFVARRARRGQRPPSPVRRHEAGR